MQPVVWCVGVWVGVLTPHRQMHERTQTHSRPLLFNSVALENEPCQAAIENPQSVVPPDRSSNPEPTRNGVKREGSEEREREREREREQQQQQQQQQQTEFL